MENDEPQSAAEMELRAWLSANDVYPGNPEMQSLVLNSFYSEFEQEDDDDLIPLDEVDPDDLDPSEGFDYRAYELSDDEEETHWQKKITYALNNKVQFLAYIDAEWRGLNKED